MALLEGPGGLAAHRRQFDAISEATRQHGIHLLLGETQELSSRKGKLVLDGIPIDVVLRYFTAEQLLEYPSGREDLELMLRAHAERRTVLFTPIEHGMMESKANLALVHDPSVRARFTAEEIRVVDRIVPWTRTIGAGSVTSAADRAELEEHCRANRKSLILKPGTACGGKGAILGRELNDREWSETLTAVRDQDYVAQEIVTPAGERVLNSSTGEIEEWQANWGIFVTDDGYAGAFIRALRADDGSVISYSNRQTRGTCVFTCGGEAR